MRFGFIDSFSSKKDFNFKSFGQGNSYETRAQMLGINVESFYEINADGEKVLNTDKLMKAINDAETKNNEKNAEQAPQIDAFIKTTENQEKTKEAKSEKKEIKEEYNTAYQNFFSNINTAAHTNPQTKETEKAWAEMKDMQFNLTKKGVTNATVIAGAAEFINKLEETVAITKAEMAENKESSIYKFTIDAQSDENADLFANNPFFTSAFETSKEEREIAIA